MTKVINICFRTTFYYRLVLLVARHSPRYTEMTTTGSTSLLLGPCANVCGIIVGNALLSSFTNHGSVIARHQVRKEIPEEKYLVGGLGTAKPSLDEYKSDAFLNISTQKRDERG